MANVCDSYCKNCMYSNTTGNGDICCNYFLATNSRRPCKAGTGCTVKKTGRKIGKWDYENNAKWVNTQKERKEKEAKKIKCKWCGNEFVPGLHNKAYCCDECRLAGYQQRYKEKLKSKPSGAKPQRSCVCPECGAKFQTNKHDKVYCSRICKDRAAAKRLTEKRRKNNVET